MYVYVLLYTYRDKNLHQLGVGVTSVCHKYSYVYVIMYIQCHEYHICTGIYSEIWLL